VNSSHVRASIACHFRYTRQCPVIIFERAPGTLWVTYKPDLIAIRKDRKVIEVEIKVSLSDLKNDINKRHWKLREISPKSFPMPYMFYYGVPYEMKDKALEVIDGWKKDGKLCGKAGLLCVIEKENIGFKDVICERKAPLNKAALKPSIRDIISIVKHQTGTLCSLSIKVAKMGRKAGKEDTDIEYNI